MTSFEIKEPTIFKKGDDMSKFECVQVNEGTLVTSYGKKYDFVNRVIDASGDEQLIAYLRSIPHAWTEIAEEKSSSEKKVTSDKTA